MNDMSKTEAVMAAMRRYLSAEQYHELAESARLATDEQEQADDAE